MKPRNNQPKITVEEADGALSIIGLWLDQQRVADETPWDALMILRRRITRRKFQIYGLREYTVTELVR